jgi:uncharacterized protein DUF1876
MTGNDDGATACRIDVSIDERTRAKARMSWEWRKLVGVGSARPDPAGEPVARTGDELALARVLSDLADQLLLLTSTDVRAGTHEPVTRLHR